MIYRTAALAIALLIASEGRAHRPSKKLLRTLAAPASVRWRDAPMVPALQRLGSVTKTALWIDRRVDPQRELTLDAAAMPLAELLDEIARQADLGMVAVDQVVYVGPKEVAALLPSLIDDGRKEATRGMRRRGVSSWSRLATPTQIATQIATDAGVEIENASRLPHDLWPAGSTPALAASDRLTLLCVGFDLRWRRGEASPRRVRIDSSALPAQPAAGNSLASLIGKQREPAVAEDSRYTLRIIDKPLGLVLRQVAKQLDRELDMIVDAGDLETLIRVEVSQATLEELLVAIGEAGGVAVTATEDRIVVGPR